MSKQTGFSFASSKKSLIETIDEIKKSKMPRNEKIVALKACGLREKEIVEGLCAKRFNFNEIRLYIRC